jgi:hypothetical protein
VTPEWFCKMREELAQILAQREAILKIMQAWKKAIENATTECYWRKEIVDNGAARERCGEISLKGESMVTVTIMGNSAVR